MVMPLDFLVADLLVLYAITHGPVSRPFAQFKKHRRRISIAIVITAVALFAASFAALVINPEIGEPIVYLLWGFALNFFGELNDLIVCAIVTKRGAEGPNKNSNVEAASVWVVSIRPDGKAVGNATKKQPEMSQVASPATEIRRPLREKRPVSLNNLREPSTTVIYKKRSETVVFQD